MLVDFREADLPESIETDLCIVGAGAAGITIATKFVGSATRVCLIESGGLTFDPQTQSLYSGQNIGHDYYPLDVSRLRYFGGTTNHWSGWCAPLNDIDFRNRVWVADSGWPIDDHDLSPYRADAQRICELGPYKYLATEWSDTYKTFPALNQDAFDPRVWQFSPPTRFADKYRAELEFATNVSVLLHANVVELITSHSSPLIEEARIRTLAGKSGNVRARTFVLACGAIETPRLLLLSNRAGIGLGNEYDLVGRYFMEHPDAVVGEIAGFDARSILELERIRAPDGTTLQMAFCPNENTQERHEILNFGGWISSNRSMDTGYDAAEAIVSEVRRGKLPSDLDQKILRLMKDFDTFVGAASLRLQGQDYEWRMRPITSTVLRVSCEQSPNADSRVKLIEDKDALGMNRVALDWKFQEIDLRSAKLAARLLAEEFTRAGLGRIKLDDWVWADEDYWPTDMRGGFHHMGTTRMAANPRKGVVDKNCKVHGTSNLYIAGSSVFSTAGYANPTLTIVAMSLRLADYLMKTYTSAESIRPIS